MATCDRDGGGYKITPEVIDYAGTDYATPVSSSKTIASAAADFGNHVAKQIVSPDNTVASNSAPGNPFSFVELVNAGTERLQPLLLSDIPYREVLHQHGQIVQRANHTAEVIDNVSSYTQIVVYLALGAICFLVLVKYLARHK